MLGLIKTVFFSGLFLIAGSLAIGLISVTAISLLSGGIDFAEWGNSFLAMLKLAGIALIPISIISIVLGIIKAIGGANFR